MNLYNLNKMPLLLDGTFAHDVALQIAVLACCLVWMDGLLWNFQQAFQKGWILLTVAIPHRLLWHWVKCLNNYWMDCQEIWCTHSSHHIQFRNHIETANCTRSTYWFCQIVACLICANKSKICNMAKISRCHTNSEKISSMQQTSLPVQEQSQQPVRPKAESFQFSYFITKFTSENSDFE